MLPASSLLALCLTLAPPAGDDLVDLRGEGLSIGLPSAEEPPALVLAWCGADCPMSKLYAPRIAELAREFEKEARFVVVFSGAGNGIDAARRFVAETGLGVAAVCDEDGELARRFGVTRSTECVVLDAEREIVYHGAVDDQYGYRRGAATVATFRRDAPQRRFLADAILAAVNHRTAPLAFSDPLGCALDLCAVPAEPQAVPTTYHADVASILQRHCQDCHRDGGAGPFPLTTYADARDHAAMIAEVTEARRMPPWNADPTVGDFLNAKGLLDEEIATLRRFAEQGAPEGDPAHGPPPRAFPKGWEIGEPDVVYSVPETDVAATGRLPYRYVRVRTHFAEDRWVRAAQIRSTSSQVVHHVLVFLATLPEEDAAKGRPYTPPIDPMAIVQDLDRQERRRILPRVAKYSLDFAQGLGGGLYGYFLAGLPGDGPIVYPQGEARLLPANATLIFQIHYAPNGTETRSGTELGLILEQEPPARFRDTRAASTLAIEIPPGAAEHRVPATYEFPRGGELLSLRPHMHLRGRSVRYELHRAGQEPRLILSVPQYDFDWQLDYVLAEPVRFEAGDRLRVEAVYDNSTANPYNPAPDDWVYFGLQTEEEMMIGYFDVRWDAGR